MRGKRVTMTMRALPPVTLVLVAAYVTLVLVSPRRSWPAQLREPMIRTQVWVHGQIVDACKTLGLPPLKRGPQRQAAYLLFAYGAVPWIVMVLLRRGRPSDLGLRKPNAVGWRLSGVGYVCAIPLIVWMVLGPTFAQHYRPLLAKEGMPVFSAYYFVSMLTEHFLFHGVMLALFRVDRRWPAAPTVVQTSRRSVQRFLQWLGLSQPVGDVRGLRAITRWLGLPDGCVVAILSSGLLFGLVHLGKDSRELLLSVPGGIGFAILAYRANSWLAPFVLHLVTAGTALAIMLVLQIN